MPSKEFSNFFRTGKKCWKLEEILVEHNLRGKLEHEQNLLIIQ